MLSAEQIEHFITFGFIKLEGCLDPGFCAEQVRNGWTNSGYDPADPTTWVTDRLHQPSKIHWKVADIAPKAYAAMGELCGGLDRIHDPQWSDGFIINFRIEADKPWQEPSAATKGWHKDGDFFHHFLDSPEQGLLTIVIWQDIAPRGGGTFIAPDSLGPVARHLLERPEGVDPYEFPSKMLVRQCRDFRSATGRAGDVYLMHPYMLHASSPNLSGIARFITNPPVHFREPMQFAPPRSPVELATCRALGVERLDFSIAGERRAVVPMPRRSKAEQEAAAAENRRRAALEGAAFNGSTPSLY